MINRLRFINVNSNENNSNSLILLDQNHKIIASRVKHIIMLLSL